MIKLIKQIIANFKDSQLERKTQAMIRQRKHSLNVMINEEARIRRERLSARASQAIN